MGKVGEIFCEIVKLLVILVLILMFWVVENLFCFMLGVFWLIGLDSMRNF